MERKRIGLLVGHVEEVYQKTFIESFLKEAFSYDYDVCVFAMYNKYQETPAREIGESTIYSLINYALFDGFVVLSDTIQTRGVEEQIEEKLKEHFDGPVLCVDKESKYFKSLVLRHYAPVKQLVEHLIKVHGYEDIAYLTGKKWHPHSTERLQAFEDCMAEHGLTIKENRIFYGDFWYSSGETMVEKLLQSGGDLPQAIACANDCMAIGVAQALEARGFRIPEDIAVIGYDSVENGQNSPKPITSAPLPAGQCGTHAAISIKAMLEGEEIPSFEPVTELFIGSSCGCNRDQVWGRQLRSSWETEDSEIHFYSRFNHMMEDILSKTEFPDLMNTIFTYVYQLKGFDSFTLCLNSQWKDLEKLHKGEAKWNGYTKQILPVIRCKKDVVNPLNYDETFSKELLIPALHEERETPAAFFFTPLHFEERCLGYSVISYGDEPRCFDDIYWPWLRNVMQGLESFRKMDALLEKNRLLAANQVRDSLTGLYNYQGILQQANRFCPGYVGVVAADIKGLSDINDRFGRLEGNRAIHTVAKILRSLMPEGVCCRLGNGEFVGICFCDENKNTMDEFRNQLDERLKETENFGYELSVYTGSECRHISCEEEFEQLINQAVAQKNGNKTNEQKMQGKENLSEEEQKEALVVKEILDGNRFRYHFQPIVNAKTGEIYAYEALMRADVTPYMSPLKILKYAEHMERLYDVERSTFFNVLSHIKKEKVLTEGRKVFINSIPGNRLRGEDAVSLEIGMKEHSGCVVVELTEQAEIPDDELSAMKEVYGGMGVETAVDDYGTGYSNITNLLRYMPNYVKIDRMLLSKIQDSPQKQHFVREIVEFAHDNDIKALAEGVETTEELQMVIHLGVDLIQGYYTAKPSEEIVSEIAEEIKNEILKYQLQEHSNKDRKVYVAGQESRIRLSKLVADKYASIEVLSDKTIYKDIAIVGVPGMATDIALDISDGYQGRITLENVSFFGGKGRDCIRIGNQCEVTLLLKGENHLEEGGICVPEGSSLVLEGDGDLTLELSLDDYFGIGNRLNEGHGRLIFGQDGCITIKGSGIRGVGIGSGNGGQISVRRGKYVIEMAGEEGVAIGSRTGEMTAKIHDANITFKLFARRNVGIGSIDGNMDVEIAHILLKGVFGGSEGTGIGTLNGKLTKADISESNLNIDMRATKISAIGTATEQAEVVISRAGLTIKCEGREALALGNMQHKCKLSFYNCDIDSNVKTTLETDIGAAPSDIYICNGRVSFMKNGEEIYREITEGEL
ncbi:MAG: EAL domain-containing protein [Lachnospiraceae bacterium]|nr:EAL domain-containing protein [Lachnospiraceae bacterium]